jgi:uncharacterized membrane protein YeiB
MSLIAEPRGFALASIEPYERIAVLDILRGFALLGLCVITLPGFYSAFFFARRSSSMPEGSVVRDLFDRWEQVWHEGRTTLSPDASPRSTSGTMNRAFGG